MKRFAAVSLAVLMLLTVFASAASAANVTSAIEIRGPVYNGSDIVSIINANGANNELTIDATQFAAFYYDIDDNVSTESLTIKNVAGTKDNVIGKGGIVYKTTIQPVKYKYEDAAAGWSNYSLEGFFAEKYVPLKDNTPDKLAKLVLDSDDKYTVRTGEQLDLGQGYTLQAKQVDVDGKKVWLELDKDGQFVDDDIVSVDSGSATWNVKLDDIQGEDDVVVLKVHVDQVFQGAVDSIAQIEGIWLIDYANAMKINSDDEFGEFKTISIGSDSLTLTTDDTFTLTKDNVNDLAEGLSFKVADDNKALRFYAMKEITDPGTYQIRGSVATGDATWNASNFAGFYYDLNDDVSTEALSVSGVGGADARVIPKGGLKYTTTIQPVKYKYEDAAAGWDKYNIEGFFAEQYVPLKANTPDKLAKLVVDSDDKYTIRTGEQLDLGQGYTIQAKQVDVDGKKVWLEFDKDGQFVDDDIVSVDNGSATWNVKLDDIQGEDDVVVLKVHVDQVFQGAVDSIAQIEGIWLIDYANAMKINSDDEFGEFKTISIGSNGLSLTSDDTVTLTRDSDVDIAEGMSFKVADSSALRYYPYVEKTIAGESNKTTTTTPVKNATTGNVTPGNATTGNVTPGNATETPTSVVTETTTETGVTEPTEAGNATTEKNTPGFGVVCGLVGLLAVVYLVRRNN